MYRPNLHLSVLAPLCFVATLSSAVAQESYPRHPDSTRQDNVPRGTVTAHHFTSSKVFPGTEREYFIYVPRQYAPEKPAALMVFQDGKNYVNERGLWQVPVVFDNLIHQGEMPVTIAICVNPGVVPGGAEAQDRFNRSLEYDTVSDRYASFLIDELIPEVQKSYHITNDPNLRAIGGSSSGAIAAFGVAWHRPDQFRRVFSTVGTYVGLRGGNEYPTLIRHTEPKPIRVFLQDGSNDQNIYGGDWWMANQTMLSALKWAGYSVNHSFGSGGHNGKHGAAILPDAMRWLWKDSTTGKPISEHPEMKTRMVPEEGWLQVSTGHEFTEGPAVAPDGSVFFTDVPRGEIWKIDAGSHQAERWLDDMPGASGLVFDSDGVLYCARNREKRLTKIEPDGSRTDIAEGMGCNDLAIVDHGIYFTDPSTGSVWYVQHGKNAKKAATGPKRPNGITVTPDQRFLLVVDSAGRYVWSYRISDDGSLQHGQPYSHIMNPRDELATGADGATMTSDGTLLVATKLGIQIFDQPGRVHLILERPQRTGALSNCVLGGKELDVLYVTSGDSVYQRKTKMRGTASWTPKQTPPRPRL